jgi:small GTP-binding protein
MKGTKRSKMVLLGDTAVGKSCIVGRFIRNEFFEFQEPTIGAAFSTGKVELEDHDVHFEIWDTAGQERYRSLAPMYYRGAQGAMVVYDITSNDSFNGAQSWIRELLSRAPNCFILLIGNKCDLEKDREIDDTMVENYVEQTNIHHILVSAKKNINIQKAFEILAEHVKDRNIEDNTTINIQPKYVRVRSRKCC